MAVRSPLKRKMFGPNPTKRTMESLEENICPECKGDFFKGLNIESNMIPTTFIHSCGFEITEESFREIQNATPAE